MIETIFLEEPFFESIQKTVCDLDVKTTIRETEENESVRSESMNVKTRVLQEKEFYSAL